MQTEQAEEQAEGEGKGEEKGEAEWGSGGVGEWGSGARSDREVAEEEEGAGDGDGEGHDRFCPEGSPEQRRVADFLEPGGFGEELAETAQQNPNPQQGYRAYQVLALHFAITCSISIQTFSSFSARFLPRVIFWWRRK